MLGERLKQLRSERNENQKNICNALNIEQSTLANYENDKRIPKIDILIKLAEYYEVSTDFLLGLSTQRTPSTTTSTISFPTEANFFKDYNDSNERRLVEIYRELSADDQAILLGKALDLRRTSVPLDIKKKEAN